MATQLLVDNSIDDGRKFLMALDQAGFPINAAFWYLRNGTWRLLIASRVVDHDGPREAYRRVNDVLQASETNLSLSDISVIGSKDALVELLRRAIRTPPEDIDGVRFTENAINNVFVEDAYIYRMA